VQACLAGLSSRRAGTIVRTNPFNSKPHGAELPQQLPKSINTISNKHFVQWNTHRD
jgi:hypothetical protein